MSACRARRKARRDSPRQPSGQASLVVARPLQDFADGHLDRRAPSPQITAQRRGCAKCSLKCQHADSPSLRPARMACRLRVSRGPLAPPSAVSSWPCPVFDSIVKSCVCHSWTMWWRIVIPAGAHRLSAKSLFGVDPSLTHSVSGERRQPFGSALGSCSRPAESSQQKKVHATYVPSKQP